MFADGESEVEAAAKVSQIASQLGRDSREIKDAIHAAEAEGAGGRVVLFKGDPANVELGPGERFLDLPNLGSPKANWAQNSGALRQEMGRGVPIRDSAVDPATGELINNTGFLRAERYLLQDRGWSFDPKTSFWLPPG
jgi:hypothetical protein